jgi:hypothetical protein
MISQLKCFERYQHGNLTSVIPATQELEIKRIMIEGQPGHKVYEIPSQSRAGHDGAYLSPQLWWEA